MNKKSLFSFFAFFLSVNLVFAAPLTLNDLEFPKTFLSQQKYSSIESIENSAENPSFLKFHVKASHAEYDVEGVIPLKKLLLEIEVIERLKQDKQGSGFVDGAAGSVRETGKGFAKLVKDPVNSAKGLGQAGKKLGGGLKGMFRKKDEGEKTSMQEKMIGGSKRELAKELGVDVYTSNPYMQGVLTRIAKARSKGRGAAMIGKMLLPVAGLVSIAVTASGLNGAADQLVNDTSRPQLYRMNKKGLEGMGFKDAEVKKLLTSPFYTPREMTYFRFYLEKLRQVSGYEAVFKKALEASSEGSAHKILYEAQLAADSMAEVAAFLKLECHEEGIVAEKEDSVILITACDYIRRSEFGEKLVDKLSNLKKERNKKNAELWNGGKITGDFAALNLLKGIKMKDWLFFSATPEK